MRPSQLPDGFRMPQPQRRGAATNRNQPSTPKRHRLRSGLLVACLIVVGVIIYNSTRPAAAVTQVIRSGISGYCLDVHNNGTAASNVVDTWSCNNSEAQDWTAQLPVIQHLGKFCLSVQHDKTIVAANCNGGAEQVWLPDDGGFLNPNTGLCLAVPQAKTGVQLTVASCDQLSRASESWRATGTSLDQPCAGTEGQKVACYAGKQWTIWQQGSTSHETLLNKYTDGTPYEAWCADFVSYVYKGAGYPFTGGEADGWDENNANNIQNMGFTVHDPQNYTPKPGDVAYFDYDGGHVEIVISGGKTPTFIYGNSGTTDPSTGNGQMAANTITSNGDQGNLIYYLSPN